MSQDRPTIILLHFDNVRHTQDFEKQLVEQPRPLICRRRSRFATNKEELTQTGGTAWQRLGLPRNQPGANPSPAPNRSWDGPLGTKTLPTIRFVANGSVANRWRRPSMPGGAPLGILVETLNRARTGLEPSQNLPGSEPV